MGLFRPKPQNFFRKSCFLQQIICFEKIWKKTCQIDMLNIFSEFPSISDGKSLRWIVKGFRVLPADANDFFYRFYKRRPAQTNHRKLVHGRYTVCASSTHTKRVITGILRIWQCSYTRKRFFKNLRFSKECQACRSQCFNNLAIMNTII